ncbi:hypothetical protein LOTGIDRAFT_177465 [Lottia gigantea]|uniref:Protein kinase domain-containing protein n=1 Tax=Lottia gigantea TaxID=225164 RepID=V3ZRX8_LOTGI|nr:hypothetical protein LOTGIDRAFT_177465 [Lottia gigantea]ESO87102.1 hypothetical protein LOTGIDRAFT_177465 [Lottia gigantea]
METTLAIERAQCSESLEQYGYRLDAYLGEGACGKIYSCERISDNLMLAVKIIRKDNSNKFLEREISVMKSLHHDNIVNLHNVVETHDKYYLIMDLASQGDLLEFVGLHGSLNSEKSKKIFRQIVAAVSHCHQQGIAHRDLKLENILLTQTSQVKLADFGFSRQMTTSDLFSQTFCGSVAYTAPEVLQGKKYSPFQSDVWSMGVLLYAMFVGRLPFDDSNVTRMVRSQLKQLIPLSADMNSELKQLILQMLNPEVEQRITLEEIRKSEWLKE